MADKILRQEQAFRLADFESAYLAKCLNNIASMQEQLAVRYNKGEYHYTLYYYD